MAMWDSIVTSPWWGDVGVGMAWLVTSCLMVAGLVGCVVPILPGHVIILIGAVAHFLMLGVDSGMEWWSLVVLAGLLVISQTLEFLSGAAGTRWFGGSRWGAFGALLGGVVGLFFMPFGLLLGPLVGAILLEVFFEKKKAKPAVASGVGSVVGTLAGMGIKIVIGSVMVVWFLVDVFLIG